MKIEQQTHYLYKITHPSGLYYIGQSRTTGDPASRNYMGGGVDLRKAQWRLGMDSFTKEILATSPDFYSIDLCERVMVTSSELADPMCLNLRKGGAPRDRRREMQRRSLLASQPAKTPEQLAAQLAGLVEENGKRQREGSAPLVLEAVERLHGELGRIPSQEEVRQALGAQAPGARSLRAHRRSAEECLGLRGDELDEAWRRVLGLLSEDTDLDELRSSTLAAMTGEELEIWKGKSTRRHDMRLIFQGLEARDLPHGKRAPQRKRFETVLQAVGRVLIGVWGTQTSAKIAAALWPRSTWSVYAQTLRRQNEDRTDRHCRPFARPRQRTAPRQEEPGCDQGQPRSLRAEEAYRDR